MNDVDLERAHRETVRWRILKTLDAGRPLPVSETVILRTLEDTHNRVTPHSLRRELDYLATRELIALSGRDGPIWSAQLTRAGIDIVDYTVDCQPGIARPAKWY